jgi:isopentenyl diphosphate isomerase/L-lactate dehydrogenase-like FMN-dependent dehydrogenase
MDDEILTTTEIVTRAHKTLKRRVWEYITGGAETETSIWRNREALSSLAFRARIFRNVATVDTSATLLGTRVRIPFILAPVGGLEQVAPQGAATAAIAASAFGTLQVVSSVSQPALEVTAQAAAGDKWFQLYIRGDFDWIQEWVGRVKAAGFKALVITADSAYYGNRERQVLRRWLPAGRANNLSGTEYQRAVDWDLFDRIRDMAGLPLVVKGVQTAEDAEIAIEHGASVVWISNHGGRQLDHCVGTAEVLPEVVAAVNGRVPIVVDGGFMRGTDALKAIALGATAVATGRLYALALAAGADAGVVRMLEILESEIVTGMGLLGVTALAQLEPAYVRHVSVPPRTGAFPLGGDLF